MAPGQPPDDGSEDSRRGRTGFAGPSPSREVRNPSAGSEDDDAFAQAMRGARPLPGARVVRAEGPPAPRRSPRAAAAPAVSPFIVERTDDSVTGRATDVGLPVVRALRGGEPADRRPPGSARPRHRRRGARGRTLSGRGPDPRRAVGVADSWPRARLRRRAGAAPRRLGLAGERGGGAGRGDGLQHRISARRGRRRHRRLAAPFRALTEALLVPHLSDIFARVSRG